MARFFKRGQKEPDQEPHHAVTASGDWMDARRFSQYYPEIAAGREFRDVNFKVATAAGVKGVFGLFSAVFVLEHARDDDDNELSDIDTIYSAVETKRSGWIHSVWQGEARWVSQIQVFLSWDMPGYEFEVSFFPDDLDEDMFTMEVFAEFLQSLLQAAGSQEYYVRFENVSWRFGDCSEESGVIFSHKDFPL